MNREIKPILAYLVERSGPSEMNERLPYGRIQSRSQLIEEFAKYEWMTRGPRDI
jgi:hypothetical protein